MTTFTKSELARVQILGVICYGEWMAYEGAKAEGAAVDSDSERAEFKTIAAQELRRYKGFTRIIEEMGADPDRAMAPYRAALETYHGGDLVGDPVRDAMWGYLGEGIAEDLLVWLTSVSDDPTCEFIDGVLADELQQEERAERQLNSLIDEVPRGRWKAGRAAWEQVGHMLASGRRSPMPFGAFLRVGRGPQLVWAVATGHAKRMNRMGLSVTGVPLPSARRSAA
jgi:hypothetical protein